jgi:Protein of unknown function (DUF2442)
MLPRVNHVEALGEFTVTLSFTDDTRATVDIGPLILDRGGVFRALQDPRLFAQVAVDPEAGTLVWPNGADIDPDVLYAATHRDRRSSV